jgi:hypothetical protein
VPTKWRLRLATRRRSSSRYRELTSEEQAMKWFSIMPKEGQWENTFSYDHPSIPFFSVSVFSTSAFTENLPLFPFPDRLPSVFSALGEKAISCYEVGQGLMWKLCVFSGFSRLA